VTEYLGQNVPSLASYSVNVYIIKLLRSNVSKHQTNSKIYGNTLKIDFAHTFMFCRVLYPNYRGIVYLSKYDFVFDKYLF
jgi:hypothetical protein